MTEPVTPLLDFVLNTWEIKRRDILLFKLCAVLEKDPPDCWHQN
eukprot:COSAG02_NODE_65066_length_259_cov_0.612500_1_plen_43_part_10